MKGFIKKHLNNEEMLIVFFLCTIFVPMWGVGYVIPFLLVLLFLLAKNCQKGRMLQIVKTKNITPVFIVFIIFLILVLFSSIHHTGSKWGSTDGFWVMLSAFIFYIFGSLTGGTVNTGRLIYNVKRYFPVAFTFIILTTVNFKTFRGGMWGEINDLTSSVLMITGALCGVFCGDIRQRKDLQASVILIPFILFAFYFSVKISSSDAALLLLVGYLFFLSVHVPDRYAFAAVWTFFLIIVISGIGYLVFNGPIDFKSLLSPQRLESFLSFRPQLWLASLSLIRQNPWAGIGSGLYKDFYEVIVPLLPGTKSVLAHSHSLYLVHFVSHGVAAGLAFITIIALNLRLVLSSLKDMEKAPLGLMVMGIWFFTLAYGLVELSPASRELVPLLWGTSGLLAGTYSRQEQIW